MDIFYQVKYKDIKTGTIKNRQEKSIGFAYISFKCLQTFQFIHDNQLNIRQHGITISIDFIHNLFTSKLVLVTIGIPVLVAHRKNTIYYYHNIIIIIYYQ
jgi:hypothetical protein